MWVLRKWHILRNWRICQGFIKGLAKNFNETTKEAYWQLAIFTKMARIHQRFCKTSNEVTKREILTNGDYKKMVKFGRKREISAKMARMPKSHRVCQNIQIRWQKVACWQMTILRKLQIWQEFIGLAKIKTRWQKRHDDNCGFYENDKFCEIGEFGFINGLAKILSETTKEAFLVCNHETRRQCWGSIQYNFSRIINMKIEFGSQRRQMLLFLTTNMAAVTSSADQQYWQ